MTNFSRPFRVCTQDKEGFYEAIIQTPTGVDYYLFDSPNKPWKTFPDLDSCKKTLTQELNQPWLEFETKDQFKSFIFSLELSQDNLWINGEKASHFKGKTPGDRIILIDTGKDWISLIQEEDLSFFWMPQKDPSYRNLGEKLVTVQDAIRKIEEMPIYLFTPDTNPTEFFKNTFPAPLLHPINQKKYPSVKT